MDPNTSLGRLCINERQIVTLNDMIEREGEWSGPEYVDTADSSKKKVEKAYMFHRMECEEVYERYITPCFMEGLHAFDGIKDLEYEKILISSKFLVKLGLTYEVKENREKVIDKMLLVSLKGELYFVNFVVNLEEDNVEPLLLIWMMLRLDALLASINFDDLPPIGISDFPPFVRNMGKSLRNKKRPTKTYKMSYDEFELEEEMVGEQLIMEYKAIKEKEDHGVFVLPIQLKGKYDFHALVDIGSNINMMPYHIYELLEREKVKPRSDQVRMLDHIDVETIGRLIDALC
ncbi:hypothetical protein Tco_0266378 [Tanacetum coccineum]